MSSIMSIVKKAFVLGWSILVIQKSIQYNKKNSQMEKREVWLRQKLIMQKEHYKVLERHLKKMYVMHHDFRHHICNLLMYLTEERLEEMQLYLSGLNKSMQLDTPIHFCRDYGLDVLIRYYYSRAEKEHIPFDVQVKSTGKLRILAEDLCTILGNLLENALEASLYLPEKERMISLNITEQSESFAIMIKNKFDGFFKQKGVLFLSRKKEKRTGLGITSVRTTVKKYGGELWTTIDREGDQSWFTVQVLMVNGK